MWRRDVMHIIVVVSPLINVVCKNSETYFLYTS